MPQNNFIKQNFVLVLGLALPVLLMTGFLVATAIPNMLTPPPQYDVVFSTNYSNSEQRAVRLSLSVGKDGILLATYTPQKKDNNNAYPYTPWQKLYLFDAKTQTVKPLDLPVPDDADSFKEKVTLPVASTKGMVLSASATAPDGYSFSEGGYRGGGGDFIGGLFWGGGHYREASLVKGNASTPIRMDAVPPYYSSISTTFIGWVTDKRE